MAANLSHGRGGAGNISKERSDSRGAEDLVTPTIKAGTYTTGRGGSGNMAKNDPNRPEIARASQDVAAPTPRENETGFHVGRGGAANFTSLSEAEAKEAKDQNKRRSQDLERTLAGEKDKVKEKERGLLEKLGLKK